MPKKNSKNMLKHRLRRVFQNAIRPLAGPNAEVKITTPSKGVLDLTYDGERGFLRARFEEVDQDSVTLHLAGEMDGSRFEAHWDLTVGDLTDEKGLLSTFQSGFAEAGRVPAAVGGRRGRPRQSGRSRSVGQPYPAHGQGESVHLGNAEIGMKVRVPFPFEAVIRGRPKRVNEWSVGEIENVQTDARPPSLPIWVNFPRAGVRASFAEDELEFLESPDAPRPTPPRPTQERRRASMPPEQVWDDPEAYAIESEYDAPHFVEEEYEEAMGGEVFGRRDSRRPAGRPRGRPVPGRRPRR